jgi:hypothetical protein
VTETAPPAPTAGRKIDLDAARRARAETRGEAPVIVLAGREWTLPAELPADVVTSFGMVVRGDVAALEDAMTALFAGQYPDLKAAALAAGTPLSWEDEKYLLESVLQEYGFDLPESSASGTS